MINMISKTYQDKFFALQLYMRNHENNYSSEHETAMWRAITTSKTVAQAIKKINSIKSGRISEMPGEKIIENMLINFQFQEN